MSEEPIQRRSCLIRALGAGVSLVAGCVSASNGDSESSVDSTDETAPRDTTAPDSSTDHDSEVTAEGGEMSTPPENVVVTNSELIRDGKQDLIVEGEAKNTGDHPVSFRVVASFFGEVSGLAGQGGKDFDGVESEATVDFEISPDREPNEEITDHSIQVYSVPDTTSV